MIRKAAFAILAILVATVVAQEGLGSSAPSSGATSTLVGVESPIISETYVLMPGDRVLTTIVGGVTYSYETWITYEGKMTVNLPIPPSVSSEGGQTRMQTTTDVVDVIRVSGLTLQQAQDTVTKEMRRYFRNVQAKLTLLGLRSGIVFVTGEVQYPGAYNASPVERVSQVIARAGGLSPLGSKTKISVIRGGRLSAIADIERFESKGDLMANPFVESGDIIYVPAVDGLVTVKGAVFGRGQYRLRASALTTEKERISEGIYELEPGDRVFDLIRKAGGITPWADLPNSYVERIVMGGNGTRKRMPVDLQKIISGGDSAENVELMNSDVLVVPPINTLVYVEGEVTSPGPFLFSPNQHTLDYIGQAGGPTNYANIKAAHILRRGALIPLRGDPVAEPGDKIVVPRVGFRFWQDYVQIVSAIGIPIASIILTLWAVRQ
jgi:protein involved in polysaccharide export with SLBB domain